MFYSQCNNCNERWELGTASTCACLTNASATIPVDRFSHLGQRTWIGLTDEEQTEIMSEAREFVSRGLLDLVEAKLKEKNT